MESHALLFRVTAYADIMNHIRRSKIAAAAATAGGNPILHEKSLSEQGIEAAVLVGLSFALLIVVAIASLVTAAALSVLAFNKIYLRVIADTGSAKEQEYANMVLKLRRRPYSVICAFVFTGSAMAELIPLLISLIIQEVSQKTVTGNLNAISIVIAVALVIVFVELLPLVYTVRRALFVNKFLIRYALDKLYEFQVKRQSRTTSQFANNEERFFRNQELTRFVELHVRPSDSGSNTDGGDVHKSVVEIMKGGFMLQNMGVRDVMLGWKNFRYDSEIFGLESKVTRETGLSIYSSGIDGALIIEVEDVTDPQRAVDIEMVPMNGKKVRGFVHWSAFISGIEEGECRAKFLSREFMPIVYDSFGDILALFSLLHHGRCKMALVVITPPAVNDKGRPNIPPCSHYVESTEKVYWSNQPRIFAYVKPIGVITYQTLLNVIFTDLSQSSQKLPDPMDRFKPTRLNTQEKLTIVDSMTTSENSQDMGNNYEKAEDTGTSTGIFERVLRFGTRRRKGTLVDAKSPVGSSRGSLFEAMEGPLGNKENEK
ncbi:hypothetical protein ABW20_dc0106451 [Dactylellina cionopaga]|nr:hypothetical protein ABW20_dc0106451 [Dactylellina cionopaga]